MFEWEPNENDGEFKEAVSSEGLPMVVHILKEGKIVVYTKAEFIEKFCNLKRPQIEAERHPQPPAI